MSDFLSQNAIILASGSASRQALLKSLGINFQVVVSQCDENAIKNAYQDAPFLEMARTLACAKALPISEQFPDAFVIGADQLCIFGKGYLDKPGSHANAFKHLKLLQGQTHQQLAAICIAKAGKIIAQFEDYAQLTMHPLSDKLIEHYLSSEQPYQSCGAYHFEGQAKWLFSAVEGSESTILGLPLTPLCNHLLAIKAIAFA